MVEIHAGKKSKNILGNVHGISFTHSQAISRIDQETKLCEGELGGRSCSLKGEHQWKWRTIMKRASQSYNNALD